MAVLIATFQINGTLGHAVKLVSPETIDLSYAILLRLWGWPMVLTLLVARFMPALRRVLRQSDLIGLPAMLRPPLTAAGLSLRNLHQVRPERSAKSWGRPHGGSEDGGAMGGGNLPGPLIGEQRAKRPKRRSYADPQGRAVPDAEKK